MRNITHIHVCTFLQLFFFQDRFIRVISIACPKKFCHKTFCNKSDILLRLPVFLPLCYFFPFSLLSLSLFTSLILYFVSFFGQYILGRFKCCGSVTHGDGSYTKRISPVDRTGSGSPTLPLLRSLKLVSSFRPAPFASPFAFIRPFPSAARDQHQEGYFKYPTKGKSCSSSCSALKSSFHGVMYHS